MLELRIDGVHIVELIVGYSASAKRGRSMPRHSSGYRMNGKLHINALLLEEAVRVAEVHAVPGRRQP